MRFAKYFTRTMNLQVEFTAAVTVIAINIYEVLSAGGVKRVSARAADGWKPLWETQKVECIQKARIFSPPIQVFLSLLSVAPFKYSKVQLSKNLL
jgi:hypothetical protein